MATNVTFNGNVYSIPAVGEDGWGQALTDYFIALASGSLQKTGGNFSLTSDANFGATYGLLAKYFSARSAAASAGLLRLSNLDQINWRNFAGTGDVGLAIDASDRLLFNGGLIVTGGISALTGDVTASGPGSAAATISANAVTNAKLAQVASGVFKARATAGTGDVEDLSGSQATALLSAFVGDTGSGGVKGLVPAPSAGDAAAGKFLKADGTFATPSATAGVNDVNGISGSVTLVAGTGISVTPAGSNITIANTAVANPSGFYSPVVAASTVNVPLSGGVLSLDGVAIVNGDRVLLKDQSTGSQNGIYTATVSSPVTEASQTTSSGNIGPIFGASQLIGQRFVATNTAVISDVKLQLGKTGSPSGLAYVKIYSDSAGSPGTLLGTSNSFDISTLTGAQTVYTFSFLSGVSITAASTYYLVFDETAGGSNSGNKVLFDYYNAGPGDAVVSSDGGATWSALTTLNASWKDLYFVVESGGFSLARSTDADTSAEVMSGRSVQVSGGTLYSNVIFSIGTVDPITLGSTSLSFVRVINVSAPTVGVAVFNESQTSGTAGGTFTSGAWQTRTLNTTQQAQSWASLASNQFTLSAGSYLIQAYAPMVGVDAAACKIYNVTDAVDAILGQSSDAAFATNTGSVSLAIGAITIASSKTFELRHYGQTTKATYGFGAAVSTGSNEVFSVVSITKVA